MASDFMEGPSLDSARKIKLKFFPAEIARAADVTTEITEALQGVGVTEEIEQALTTKVPIVAQTSVRRDYHLVNGEWPPRPTTDDPLRFLPWPKDRPDLAVANKFPTQDGRVTGGGGMVIGKDSAVLAQFQTPA